MKSDELRKRLNKNRTMVPVSIRMPEDIIEDLKRIAPQLDSPAINRSFEPT